MPLTAGPRLPLAPDATLWTIIPTLISGGTRSGPLFAYNVGKSPAGALTYLWDSSQNSSSCPALPVTEWAVPTFNEPTLAEGTAYVATYCATTSGTIATDCSSVPTSKITSGILVFRNCP